MRFMSLGSSQRSKSIWVALTTLVLLVGVSVAKAQSTGAGSVQGTVTDAKGAVVPGAAVQIVNSKTNVAANTVSNSVGFYSVPALFAGDYTVSASANGMAKWQANLTLLTGQTAVVDAHLKVGSITTEVTVVGDQTTAINTEDAVQGTTVGRQQIEQIPMNGRSVAGVLSSTVPGYIGGSGNQPRVNGLVWGAFSWSQDGAPMDYRDGGGLDNVPPDPDTVQEVRVETSDMNAAADRPGYATWSTKSGTNSIHGSVFETNRDSSFGVAHNRQDSTSAKAPKLIRNEYGISMGGPIYVPGFGKTLYNGKDKSFWFGSWEAMSLRQSQYKFYYVPTMAMRNGDFSQATASNGTLYSIYDPDTTGPGTLSSSGGTGFQRQQFVYNGTANVINPARISSLAKALYAITPQPTNAGNPYAASTENWQGALPISQQQYDYTMRFDHHFSDSNTVFFRYSLGHRLQYNFGSNLGAPTTDGIYNGQFQPLDSQSGVLSWTHISSPTFYQTPTISMDYQSWKQQGSPGSVVNKNVTASLNLENMFGTLGLPQIEGANSGTSNGAQNSMLQSYDQGSNPWRDSDYTNVFADNLTWIKGRHQILFGGEYRHDQLRIQPDQSRPTTVVFGGLGTANLNTGSGTAFSQQPNTGLAAADFFLGNAQSYTNAISPAYLYLRDQETDFYVQDNFHVRSNLTLNLGLRYEALPALHEKNNQFSSFDYKTGAIVTGQSISKLLAENRTTQALVTALQAIGVVFETPTQAGMPAGVFKNYWWNFLPRVGATWMPFGNRSGLVLRGGYGDYAYKTPARNIYGGFNESNPYTASLSQDYTNPLQTDGYSNYIIRSPQTVIAGQNSTNVINANLQNSICAGCFGLENMDPNQTPEGYKEWDFVVEKQLPNRASLSVAYLGNHGYNLEQIWYTNTAPTNYVWYMTTGLPVPSGTYSRTAWRIYDKTMTSPVGGPLPYGEIQQIKKTGFSNANMLQVQYHRLYNRGIEYNISYVYGKYFRMGGNTFRDSEPYEPGVFIPGIVSSDPLTANRYQFYLQDTATPRHMIKYDWVVDLPVGKGKWLLGNANKAVNAILGGWELSGTGSMSETLWQPTAGDYGPTNPLHLYKRSMPIQDCTSGTCRTAYLGYNGFITSAQYNTGAAGKGYTGLPGSWTSQLSGGFEHQPYNLQQNNQNVGPDSLNATNHPTYITLASGQQVSNVAYQPGPNNSMNPNYRVFLPNPFNFDTDASLFKVFPITERVGLKINGDFFNVFNQQGTTGIGGGNGIITTTSSYNTARVMQISARLTW